ncbi:MAG: hypothetical protein ACREJM_07875, partial [Candidatus Saccharimonadales bacterium]
RVRRSRRRPQRLKKTQLGLTAKRCTPQFVFSKRHRKRSTGFSLRRGGIPSRADKMGHGSQPSWSRLVFWLIAAAVCLELLADVLPRLVVPLAVLGAVVAILRVVFFHTRRW